jgi:hypothetical protein
LSTAAVCDPPRVLSPANCTVPPKMAFCGLNPRVCIALAPDASSIGTYLTSPGARTVER